MKKVMFALCFMFGGMVVVSAQDTQDTTSNQYRTETQSQYPQNDQAQSGFSQQDRERIQSTELPDEVKRTLEDQEYRGWLISGAFKAKAGDQSQMNNQDNTSPDNTNNDANRDANRQESANATGAQDEEIYIVELKNGAETKTIAFDKNGQQLEGMGDMQNSQNQNSQFNQNGQSNQEGQTPNNQYNQNDQADQSPESGQTDPSSTTDPADQSQSESANETRTDERNERQSPDQSTDTENSQSTQTDQSRANEPE